MPHDGLDQAHSRGGRIYVRLRSFSPADRCGGGNSTIMIGLLKVNPSLGGIVFDQPAAEEQAKKQIEDNGLAGRCQTVAQDFFKKVPGGGDAYILRHVVHDWDERAVTILKNCHRAMGPHGRLLILEGVYPQRIIQTAEGRGAASNDVNMLVGTAGRQRSKAEFHSR